MPRKTVIDGSALINSAQLRLLVPFSPSYIYRLEKRGAFPMRIKIGERSVAWVLAEVLAWIENRKAASKT